MINKLSQIFGSKTKAQEILLLQKDVKKVVRQGFYEQELPKIEKFCEQNNLSLVKSKFKVLLADESSYSNKGVKIQSHDKRPGMYFVYISKSAKDSWTASYYELMNNQEDLGKILGYPDCCINFFLNRFTPDNPNLELQPKNLFTNLTKRDQDCVILSHFPCSSECEQSIELAKLYLDTILKEDKRRVMDMVDLLSLPKQPLVSGDKSMDHSIKD